jgi:hypothetical protein
VNAEAVATPFAPVASVSVFVVLVANVPLAPVAGAANVTDAPLIGFESASNTVTATGVVNAVLTVVLCGVVPVTTVIVAGAPAKFVRLKLAGVVTPATVAVTV